jgi:hypothetical protein
MRLLHADTAETSVSTATLVRPRRTSSNTSEIRERCAIARCPRCRCELVPVIAGGQPFFTCRCPVRRIVALSKDLRAAS